MKIRSVFNLLVIALLSVAAHPARAASSNTWQGITSDPANPANWSNGVPVVTPQNLFFGIPSGGVTTINIPAATLLAASVTFDGTAPLPAYSFQGVSGATIALQGGVSVLASGGFITFGSDVTIDLTTGDHHADIVAGGALRFGGRIQGAGASIVKEGAGSLMLSGQNTYTGGTTVSGGTLLLGSNSTLNGSFVLVSGPVGLGTLTLGHGSTLAPASHDNLEIANPITVSGTVTIGDPTRRGELKLTGLLSGTGNIDVVSDSTGFNGLVILGSSGSNPFDGEVTYTGDGALMLNGSNVFSGVSITTGSLYLGNDTTDGGTIAANDFDRGPAGIGNIYFNVAFALVPNGRDVVIGNDLYVHGPLKIDLSAGFDLLLGGTINNNEGDGSLKVYGPGILTLMGANNFAGGVKLLSGTLKLGSSSTDDGYGGVSSGPVGRGKLTLYDETALIPLGDLLLGNEIKLQSGYITFGDEEFPYDLHLTGLICGTGAIDFYGPGARLTLGGDNTFTGGVFMNISTVLVLENSSRDGEGNVMADPDEAVTGPAGTGSIYFFENTSLLATSNLWLSNRLELVDSDTTLQIGSEGQYNYVLGGRIVGTGGIEFLGAKLTLLADNEFDGGLYVGGGTLRLSRTTQTGEGGEIITSPVGRGRVTFEGGSSLEVGFTADNVFLLNPISLRFNESDGGVLTIDTAFGTSGTPASERVLSLLGDITGDSGTSLVKKGHGILVLSGGSTINGGVEVFAGTLAVGGSSVSSEGSIVQGPLGRGTLTLRKNTALVMAFGGSSSEIHNDINLRRTSGFFEVEVDTSTGALALLGDIAQTGPSGLVYLRKVGTGTLTLGGQSNFDGGVKVAEGTLQLGSSTFMDGSSILSSPIGVGDLVLFSGSTLQSGGNSPSILHLSNDVHLFSSEDGSQSATISVLDENTLTLLGPITQSLLNPSDTVFKLVKTGSGTLVLGSEENSYLGSTLIQGGTIATTTLTAGGSPSGIGMSSALASNLVLSGGTLEYIGSAPATTDRLFTVEAAGGGIESAAANPLHSVTFSNTGAVAIPSPATPRTLVLGGLNGGDNTLMPVLSGAISLLKSGAGKWILGSANMYTGDTTIGAGTLTVGALNAVPNTAVYVDTGAVFDVANSTTISALSGAGSVVLGGTLTISSSASATLSTLMSGTGGLTYSGTGTLLVFADQGYTGATTVNAGGTVRIGAAGTVGSVAGALVSNGGTFRIDRSTSSDIVGPVSGSGTFEKSASGLLRILADGTFSGNVTVLGGTLQFGNGGTAGGLFSASSLAIGANKLVVNRSDNFAYTGLLSGSGTLEKAGAGRLSIDGGNTFSGLVDVTGGILAFSNTVSAGTLTALKVAAGATFEANRTFGFNTIDGAGTLAIGGSRTLTVDGSTSGHFDGAITGGNLTKNTTSTLILNGSYTLSGQTIINEGVLAVGPAGAFGGTGNLTIYGSTANAIYAGSGTFARTFGTSSSQVSLVGVGGNPGFAAYGGPLALTGLTGTWGTTNGFLTGSSAALLFGKAGLSDNVVSWSGNINLGAATRTIQVDDNAVSTADKAVISGVVSNGSLIKTGNGILELSGANTYTGGTTVSAGTLVAANSNAFGTGTVTIDGGAIDVASGISLNAAIAFGASGGRLGGTGTYSAPLVITNNVILAPGNSPGTMSFTGGLTLASGGTLSLEVQDASGAAGTGYDLIAVSGLLSGPATSLDIAATFVSPFTIQLVSLNGSGAPGPTLNFASGSAFSWTFATAANGISGFAANKFTVDSSAFSNTLGGGAFSVASTGSSLTLNFTPVPEPSTWAMLAAGSAMLVGALRRRQHRAAAR